LLRTVTAGLTDVDVSVLVEGSSTPLTVKLLDSPGAVVVSGGLCHI